MSEVICRKTRVKVGDLFSCQYPVDGRKNILKNHVGVVRAVGRSANGPYVTIEEVAGEQYRTLLYKKMYRPKVVKS